MPKIKATQTTETQVNLQTKVQAQILGHCKTYQTELGRRNAADLLMDVQREAVLQLGLEHVDSDKFEVDGFKIALVTDAETSKLDKDKLKKLLLAKTKLSLAELDVLFERATKKTPTKPYSKITPPSDKRLAKS